jgi:hypothetical protein
LRKSMQAPDDPSMGLPRRCGDSISTCRGTAAS